MPAQARTIPRALKAPDPRPLITVIQNVPKRIHVMRSIANWLRMQPHRPQGRDICSQLQPIAAVDHPHPHMILGLADNRLGIICRALNQGMQMFGTDADRQNSNLLNRQTFEEQDRHLPALVGRKLHCRMFHQSFGLLVKSTLVVRRCRRISVIALNMYAMFSFAPPTRVAAQPLAVRIRSDVVPVVPSHSCESYTLRHMPCKAWALIITPPAGIPRSLMPPPLSIPSDGWRPIPFRCHRENTR